MGDKPTAAMVLSLLGGLAVLGGGAFQAFLGSFISSIGSATTGGSAAVGVGTTIGILGILGIVFGIIMILGAIMMYSKPTSHTMWGVIILILSLVSLATSSLGGFVLGFILGLIGGILGIVFKPQMTPGMMPGQPMGSMPMGAMGAPAGGMGTNCKNCGAAIPAGATRCPSCGASL